MKRFILFCAAITIVSQSALATPKADSILAFTGASRAKFVWDRYAWANADYTGKSSTQLAAEGMTMMLFDTQEGTERVLDKTASKASNHAFMRISRSSKWATWNDIAGTKTYIIDLTSPTATKRVLMDKATCLYWAVRAFWVDPSTGTEYVYSHDNYTSAGGKGIYKTPLKADGTADLTKAVKLFTAASIDDPLSVSQDGKKVGCAVPWPTTGLVDVATAKFDVRHNGQFGCQANLAPDNSYRNFHCEDDHLGVIMFGPFPSTDNWFVDMSKNLAGNPATNKTDFNSPRWTNHVQFVSNTFPMGDNGERYEEDDMLVGQSASYVKALKIHMVGSFVLQKFSADFKSIASSIGIGQDVRYRQTGGDGWLSNGVAIAATSLAPGRAGHQGQASIARAPHPETRVTDVQGRQVRRAAGVDSRDMAAGAYFVAGSRDVDNATRQVRVTK